MKLWKKTVILMLVTLLVSLALVGGITLSITGRRSVEGAALTYRSRMAGAAGMMEQFWDESKYQWMTEVGKKSYLNFQFGLCCGEEYILLGEKQDAEIEEAAAYEVLENPTEYQIADMSTLPALAASGDYRIQRLDEEFLMLQMQEIKKPEGLSLLSVRNITEIILEIRRLAMWYLGIYCAIFLFAGFFIWQMMRKTVRAMEELQEVAEKQEMLLGALAHEMKTPLTSIIGYSDSLLHVKLKEEQKTRALEQINREGKRMEKLSGKMLQMMGLYQNDAVTMEVQSVSELIRHVEEMEAERCMERGVWLQTEFEDFTLKMDMELIESLLLNLIDNALRASKTGDRIILRAKQEGKEKFLQVEDQGSGIPEEELKKVTQAFYMVDKSRSRREGGAGLGLALCQKIAELHHGELEIQSKVGSGTVVTVRF